MARTDADVIRERAIPSVREREIRSTTSVPARQGSVQSPPRFSLRSLAGQVFDLRLGLRPRLRFKETVSDRGPSARPGPRSAAGTARMQAARTSERAGRA